MNLRFEWVRALLILFGGSIAAAVALREAPHDDRGAAFVQLALLLFATPLLFLLIPRAWLAFPRIVIFTWWILPIGVGAVSLTYLGDMGDKHMFAPLYVVIAAFWAMFAPVVIIGLRKSRRPA